MKTKCLKMSLLLRKPAFCICENKDADQLRGNREADQRLCFCYTDTTYPLLSKSENFKLLAIFCGCTARFVWDLVGNLKDRFSHNEAQMMLVELQTIMIRQSLLMEDLFCTICKNLSVKKPCIVMILNTALSFLIICLLSLYPPQTVFVGGYTVFTLSVRPSVRTNERKCVRKVLFP